MGLLDRFRTPKPKPQPKRTTKKRVITPPLKPLLPITKTQGHTLEDVMRAITTLTTLIQVHDSKVMNSLSAVGKQMSSERLAIMLSAKEMLSQGQKKSEIAQLIRDEYNIPKRTVYRWLQ